MTVSSVVTPRVQYAGSGSTGPFSVTYPFSVAGDLEVTKTNTSGVDSILVLTTDYTVSGGGTPPTTGSVTLTVALAVGETLTIRRNTSKTQGTDYIENDSFPAEVHEGALDKLTLITQELEEVSGRSVVLSSTSTLSGVEFPAPGADQFIKWNVGGTALETTTLSGLGAVSAGTGLTLASDVMSYTGELDDNSDVSITAAAKGDILVFNGTSWVDLTVGSNTQVLTADSAEATGIKWAAPVSNLVDDTTPQLGGDLDLNGNNIDFPTTPNISDCLDEDNMSSNSATALATQQSIKAYVDASAGSVIVDETNITSSTASYEVTGLGDYKSIIIHVYNASPVTDGDDLRVFVSDDNGATYETTNYDMTRIAFLDTGTASNIITPASTTSGFSLSSAQGNAATEEYFGTFRLDGFNDATTYTYGSGMGSYETPSGAGGANLSHGVYAQAAALDAVQVKFAGGNISSGRFIVIGIK